MPDANPPKQRLRTRLSHGGRAGTHIHGFVNPPVTRGSTVLYPDIATRRDSWKHRLEQYPIYGVCGTPTHYALEDVIAGIEGGTRCQLVCSGLAAVTMPLQAYLGAGDHCLMPDSAYGPTRSFCDGMLARAGVTTTYYDPEIGADALAALIRPETRVLYLESPGSHTFEMQDVPALAAVARARGVTVMMDNTWGILHFQPFQHGVDVSIQALTKYVGGHSDVLLGSVTTNSEEHWRRVRDAALQLGQYASSDDVWLALRGARTLEVRLKAQEQSALAVAAWLQSREEVAEVLHPALPGARGHAIWQRDFTGACSLFGVVFRPEFTPEATHKMIESLELFGIGASWGGFESLALPTTGFVVRSAGTGGFAGPSIRLHVGLEDTTDIIEDLSRGLEVLRAQPRANPDSASCQTITPPCSTPSRSTATA
jgi:cystathionine beta-lyase